MLGEMLQPFKGCIKAFFLVVVFFSPNTGWRSGKTYFPRSTESLLRNRWLKNSSEFVLQRPETSGYVVLHDSSYSMTVQGSPPFSTLLL